MAKIAIIIYSLYSHVATMAKDVKKGVDSVEGAEADVFQVPETLSDDIRKQLGDPPKLDLPVATADTLVEYDGIIFGMPTRFGSMPAQIKAFIDGTGGLWANGALYHKPVGVFVSTGTGGGKELTVYNCLSTFAHHGMLYVPLGYGKAYPEFCDLSQPNGASPWGAGCLAASDGSRQPSETELRIARIQGEEFATTVVKQQKSIAAEKKATKPEEKTAKTDANASKETKPVVKSKKTTKTAPKEEPKKGLLSRILAKTKKFLS